MTDTIQNPLSVDQNRRAAAVSLAAEVTKGRINSSAAILDLADYIVGTEPCPLAGLVAITFDGDLGEAPAPAEPEVITVGGIAGIEALTVGSVVKHPIHGWRYIKTESGWVNIISPRRGATYGDSAMAGYPAFIVDYIPGGA